jgi:hypothetical protein
VRSRRRQRLEDLLRAVEHARLQVVLRERESRLLALAGFQRLPGGDVLVHLDRAVHLAAAAIEAAEREVRLDRVVVELDGSQEGLERTVRLLVDQEVDARHVVAAQSLLADVAGARLARGVEADCAAEEQDPDQYPDRFRVHALDAAPGCGVPRPSRGSGATAPH